MKILQPVAICSYFRNSVVFDNKGPNAVWQKWDVNAGVAGYKRRLQTGMVTCTQSHNDKAITSDTCPKDQLCMFSR